MSRLIATLLLIVIAGAANPLLAQDATSVPATEDIVRALNPDTAAQFRSLKGVKVIPGQEPPAPSIDLTVNFAFDSAKLDNETLLTLKRLGAALQDPRLARFTFLIAGHTDAKGSDEYNQKLSEQRASAVRDHLIFFYDVAPERLASVGYGKQRLLKPDDPENAANRRVQIINVGPNT
jgi:outer membrane protein OmpA-like peptidoglycan-associated protein